MAPRMISEGSLLKTLSYTFETAGPQCIVSIRNSKSGDVEYNGYGKSTMDAVVAVWDAGYELVIGKPAIKGRKIQWRTRRRHSEKIGKEGQAVRRMYFVIEALSEHRFSLSAKQSKDDAAERIIYGRSVEDVVMEAFEEGYQIVTRLSPTDKSKNNLWETINAD